MFLPALSSKYIQETIRGNIMIEFINDNEEIELKSFSAEATLVELVDALEDFRLKLSLKTINCKGCGECCSDNIPVLGLDLQVLQEGLEISFDKAAKDFLVLPEKPDLSLRRKAIGEMSKAADITQLEAALLYEYNNAEPIILAKQDNGECCFLKNRLCSRYVIRPYSCGLYLCNMGEKLSYIQEMIIRQGTWHAYYKLGWIGGEEISHNPFLKASKYSDLLVADFDFQLGNTLEQLFFYF